MVFGLSSARGLSPSYGADEDEFNCYRQIHSFTGLDIDAQDQLIVTCFWCGIGAVVSFDPKLGKPTIISSGGIFETTHLLDIQIADNGDMYVHEHIHTGGVRITKVDPISGVQTIVTQGGLISRSSQWGSTALDPAGMLILPAPSETYTTGRIVSVDPDTGEQQLLFTSDGLVIIDIVIDESSGDLFASVRLSQSGSYAIVRIDITSGVYTIVYQETGSFRISDIAINSSGNLIALRRLYDESIIIDIIEIDPTNGDYTVITQGGYLTNPADVDVDYDDSILVTDYSAKIRRNAFGHPSGMVIRVDPVTGEQSIAAWAKKFIWPQLYQ